MPFNGSGQYSAPTNSWNPAVGGSTIDSADWNATQSDYETAFSNVICKDGQTTITANLPMAGFKHTGVNTNSGSTSRSEYVSGATFQDGASFNGGTTGGTSTAYTATLTPAISAYAGGQRFRIKFNAACGDNPTLNLNSVGALKLYKEVTGSFVQFSSGGIPANFDGDILYDASLDSSAGGFVVLNAPLYAQGTAVASASTINLDTATGDYVHITGTTTITAVTLAQGQTRKIVFDGALTFTNGASLILPGGASITTAAGDTAVLVGEASSVVRCISYSKASGASIVSSASVPVRQTVLSGPVDSNGLASFGGSTGSTTVTMSGTLVATAANGFSSTGGVNLVGSGTNLSWTGLSTNGTMYLYVDVGSDGSLTAGSGTLAPTYQWGGTYSTTSGQFTFNIQEMVGKVGNGSTAAQTYRVYVGQVTVAGNVVTAIVWYQLMGRFRSASTAGLPALNSATSVTHNLGFKPKITQFIGTCTTTDNGWSVGDEYHEWIGRDSTGTQNVRIVPHPNADGLTMTVVAPPSSGSYATAPKGGGIGGAATLSSWSYITQAQRDW